MTALHRFKFVATGLLTVMVMLVCSCSSAPLRQPPGYAAFEHHGVQPVVDTAEERVATVGLARDHASYKVALHYLAAGRWPPASAIRVEDFVTALAVPRRASTGRHTAGSWFNATLGPSPFRPGWHVLVVRITPRYLGWPIKDQAPFRVVSDRDGALEQAFAQKGIPVVRGGLASLFDDGQPGFARPSASLAGHVGGHQIFISSGAGLGGREAQEQALTMIAAGHERGALVSVIGRIEAGLDDALLDAIARAGGGIYDIWRAGDETALVESMTRPLVALDATISVRFESPRRWRLVGHESTTPAPWSKHVAGVALADDEVRVVFEVDLAGTEGALGAITFEGRRLGAREPTTLGPIPLVPTGPDPLHARVALVAMAAEVLRGSYWAKDVSIDLLSSEATKLAHPDVIALVEAMVRAAPARRSMRPSTRESILP